MTESRIVQLSFDNAEFEKNVKQSLDTLSKLNDALKFDDGSAALESISKASKKLDLSGISESISDASGHFSKLEIMGVTALANVTNAAVNFGKKITSSIIQPLTSGGWQRALNMEQAKFMLNGLLGEKAKKAIGSVGELGSIMDNIYKSVDGTIYSLDKAALVAARLMASGIVGTGENAELTKILQAVAGVSSVFSTDYERVGDLFSTIKSTGQLMGQQVLSFTTMGVPLYAKLAEYLNKIVKEGRDAGKSLKDMFPENDNLVKYLSNISEGTKITEKDIKEMVSKGAIDFGLFSDAMYDAFGSQASKSKEMYIGALEDMKAAAARIGEKFAKPFIGDSTAGISGVFRDILNASVPLLDSIGNRLSAEGGIIERFSSTVEAAGKRIVLVMDLISAAFDMDETKTQLQRLVDNGLADPSRLKNLEKFAYQIARIKDVIAAVGNIFSAVIGILGAGFRVGKGILEFFLSIAESLLTVLAGARTPLAELQKNIKTWGKDLGSFIGNMTKIILNSELLKAIVELIGKAFSNLRTIVTTTGNAFVDITKTITEMVHVLATGLAKTIKSVVNELKGVFDLTSIVNTTIMGSLAIKVGKIFELLKGEGMAFGAIFGDIQKRFGHGLLNNLRKSSVLLAEDLDQLRVTLLAYQKNVKANIMLKIAASILALAIAIKIMSSIDTKQLAQSIIALGILGGILTVLMKRTLSIVNTLGKLNLKQLATLQIVKGVFISLALALIGMALAVKIMGSMDMDQAVNGLLGLIVIASTLYLLFKYMAKVQKIEDAAAIGRLLVIALAIDMLALAFVKLGKMDGGAIKKATAAMTIISGLIIALQFVMNKISKVQNVASIIPLIGMGIAIGMFANTFRKLAMLEWDQIKQGTVAMAVSLGSILAVFAVLGKVKLQAFASALALARIAGVIQTVFGVFQKLSGMSYGEIKKAGLGLLILEGAIGSLFVLLGRLTGKEGAIGSKDIMQSLTIAILLVSISNAIKLMATSFINLGSLSWGEIGKAAVGMTGIIGIIGVLVAISKLLSKTEGTKDLLIFAGTLVLLGVGFKIFAAGIAAMGSMNIGTLAVGILGVAASILILNGVAKIVSKTFYDFLKMTAGMVAFGLGLAAVGAGAFVMGFGLASLANALKNITTEDVVRISVLVAVMALLSPIVKGIGISFLLFGAGIAAVGVGLIAIGVGLGAIGLGFKVLVSSAQEAIIALTNFANIDLSSVFRLAGLTVIFGVLSPLLIAFGVALIGVGAGLTAVGVGTKLIISAFKILKSIVDSLFEGLGESLVSSCKQAVATLEKLIPSTKNVTKALKTIADNVKKTIKQINDMYDSAVRAGKHVVDGVVSGITNNTSSAVRAANDLAKKTLEAYKKAMGIESPSKEMAKLARYTVLGTVKGIKDNTNLAVRQMESLSAALLSAYEYANSELDLTPTITPVVDTSNIDRVASDIGNMMDLNRSLSLAADNSYGIQNGSKVSSIDRLAKKIDGMTESMNSRSLNTYVNVDGATDPEAFADGLLRSFKLNARTV